jgi:hypothetical protein
MTTKAQLTQLAERVMGRHFYRDRIGYHFFIGPWWMRLCLVFHRAMWAGTFRIARRLIWMRPIDYEAVARAAECGE